MSLYDEQIKERIAHDDNMVASSIDEIKSAVTGGNFFTKNDQSAITESAINEILNYYHIRLKESFDNIKDFNERLEYMIRPSGIMRRSVKLGKGWYKDATGPMLGRFTDGTPIAFIPSGFSGYSYINPVTGKRTRLSARNENLFSTQAIGFYKPLPLKKLGIPDLIQYIAHTLSASDIMVFALSSLAVALVGLISPVLYNFLISKVLPSGSIKLLYSTAVFMICVVISSAMFDAIKNLLLSRIDTKMSVQVEAASMMRILSMPADFFKKFSSGELATKHQYIQELCNMISSAFMSTGLTSLFSLIYIIQIYKYAPMMATPAILIILITTAFTIITMLIQMKISRQLMETSAKENGLSYALISGIQKIKLSGSEKRAYARWASLYSVGARLSYSPPVFIKLNSVIFLAISLIGNIVLYYIALESHVSVASYYAFNTAYAMVAGAFTSLSDIAMTLAQINPVMEITEPILKGEPEQSGDRHIVTNITGGIELSHISFRYGDNMPLILDDLSLKILPGQYVAIVGSTGCGKSTLLRILLGFEKPQKGAVYYDNTDLKTLDMKSLRRRIGVVMQDGKLFQGDIFSNITVSAPWLTKEDAWKAARLAGIDKDIQEMPMGMNTIIPGGNNGLSGGQRQRIMIARAVAPEPKILFFDEATSALDNITQKRISNSLDDLKCTRVVIAHRLSTIRNCDRIIVLDGGHIIEDGKYMELIEKNGFFSELVKRQRLDISTE